MPAAPKSGANYAFMVLSIDNGRVKRSVRRWQMGCPDPYSAAAGQRQVVAVVMGPKRSLRSGPTSLYLQRRDCGASSSRHATDRIREAPSVQRQDVQFDTRATPGRGIAVPLHRED